jgi:hypothetical protein
MRRPHHLSYAIIGFIMLCTGDFAARPASSAQQTACLVVTLNQSSVACKDVAAGNCLYTFTVTVQNNTTVAGAVVFQPAPGGISIANNPTIAAGSTATITGTLTVPCWTSTVNCAVSMPGTPCKVYFAFNNLPMCSCAVSATSDQTICKGGSAHIDLPANTPGTITWYSSSPCAPPIPASGVVPAGWSPATCAGVGCSTSQLNQTTCYQAVVSNVPGCPNGMVSNVVTVTVMDPGSGSITYSGPTDLCTGSVVNLSYSNATASTGCGFAWEQWHPSTQWQPINGSANLTPLPAQTLTFAGCPSEITKFRVKSSCPPCGYAYTEISFNVYGPTVAGTITATKPVICEGQDDVLTLTSNCGQVLQWESWDPAGNLGFVPISGSAGATTWFTNKLSTDMWYQAKVQNGPCGAIQYTPPLLITVNHKPNPTITAGGMPTTFCDPGSVMLTATNPNGGTCHWYVNGLPMFWGGTGMSLSATATANYYVVCTNGCGSSKSNIIKVTDTKVVAEISGPCGVCAGGCVTLNAIAAGGVGSYTGLWTAVPPITSSNNQSLSLYACPTTTTTYQVLVTDSNGCSTTATHVVNICQKPPKAVAGKHQTIQLGGMATIGFTPTASGGSPPYTYSWYPSTGLNNTTIANPTASPGQTTTYTVTVTDANGCKSTSTVTVTVTP